MILEEDWEKENQDMILEEDWGVREEYDPGE
jgi:hypothetical protein